MTELRKGLGLLLGMLAIGTVAACSTKTATTSSGTAAENAPPASAAQPANEGNAAAGNVMPLSFDVPLEGGAFKTLHTAFLEAVVDGRATRLIVDSGASDHVFVREVLPFAEKDLRDDSPGTDHAGAPVTTWRVRRPIQMQVGSIRHTLDEAIVILGPPPFKEWGIGGFVAPQLLATEGFVVVDLKQRTLALVEAPPKTCPSGHPPLSLPIVPQGGDARRLPIVKAKYNGAAIRLLLNTGGKEVELSPAFAQAAGEETTTGKGVSGKAVKGARGKAGSLQLQDVAVPIASPLIRDQGAHADAQVGIAFLTDAILAFPAKNTEAVHLCLSQTR